jgi:hypothetical protein
MFVRVTTKWQCHMKTQKEKTFAALDVDVCIYIDEQEINTKFSMATPYSITDSSEDIMWFIKECLSSKFRSAKTQVICSLISKSGEDSPFLHEIKEASQSLAKAFESEIENLIRSITPFIQVIYPFNGTFTQIRGMNKSRLKSKPIILMLK